MKGAAFVHFTNDDVVRNPLVTRIVRAYEKRERDVQAARGGKKKT